MFFPKISTAESKHQLLALAHRREPEQHPHLAESAAAGSRAGRRSRTSCRSGRCLREGSRRARARSGTPTPGARRATTVPAPAARTAPSACRARCCRRRTVRGGAGRGSASPRRSRARRRACARPPRRRARTACSVLMPAVASLRAPVIRHRAKRPKTRAQRPVVGLRWRPERPRGVEPGEHAGGGGGRGERLEAAAQPVVGLDPREIHERVATLRISAASEESEAKMGSNSSSVASARAESASRRNAFGLRRGRLQRRRRVFVSRVAGAAE